MHLRDSFFFILLHIQDEFLCFQLINNAPYEQSKMKSNSSVLDSKSLFQTLSPGYPDMRPQYFHQGVSTRICSTHSARPCPIAAWNKT